MEGENPKGNWRGGKGEEELKFGQESVPSSQSSGTTQSDVVSQKGRGREL